MDTMQKYGLSKRQAILLFVQMILVILALFAPIYLLIFLFTTAPNPWMIATHILVLLSLGAIFAYAIVGYKKGELLYQMVPLPFMAAVMVNILMPGRDVVQIVALSILFALTLAFVLPIKSHKAKRVISILMVISALIFSLYSEITANTNFLGEIQASWMAYVAMYLSIFVPTIISGTFALTYYIRLSKEKLEQGNASSSVSH